MKNYTFLGHDNASLSMLMETSYALWAKEFTAEIISIVDISQGVEVPYKIPGVNTVEKLHDQWMIQPDNELLLGSMVAKIKKKIYLFFEENYGVSHEFYSKLVHPSVILAETASYAHGTTIGPGAILAPFAELGHHVSINRNVTVGHHTQIHDFATLNPGCNIAGFCTIKKGATIGMGANVIDGQTIGENSFVGAGSLVTKSIPDNSVAYGVPAKVIRKNV